MEFQKLAKEHKSLLDSFFHARYSENSYYTFVSCFMWRDLLHIHWAIEDAVLYLTSKFRGRFMVLQPFGADDKLDAAAAKQIAWMQAIGEPFCALDVEPAMAARYAAVDPNLVGRAVRDAADYLYKTEDLIHLAGRRFHTKKNHLNNFRRNFPEAAYVPITSDVVPSCEMVLDAWYKRSLQKMPDDPYVATERHAILEVLHNFQDFGLKGGAIALGERIVAFTFGEQLNEDTVVIYVEKGAPDIPGAYALINQAFLAHEWAHLPYVNREEDMGFSNLRKAKESYRPIRMIEKYTVQSADAWKRVDARSPNQRGA